MRVLSFTSNGGTINSEQDGYKIGLSLRGTGLPDISTQWFEGAGDGSTFRGGRNLSRVLDIPITIYGVNREQVRQRISAIGKIFSLDSGDVRITAELDGDNWFIDARRTGGGDWSWSEDTDGRSFVKTVITVQAGSPFWTHEDEDARVVTISGLGRGLIEATSLSKLRVSTNTAFGEVTFQNEGDVPASPRWEIMAPFTGFTLTSESGETITWTGVKITGKIVVNTDVGTVVDENGVNQYAGLSSAPLFWSIPAGDSLATVIAQNATVNTKITAYWRTKRWVMF